MSNTKQKAVDWWWSARTSELAQAGSHPGGRRVITGMLTGSSESLDDAAAAGKAVGAGPQK